MSRQHDACGAPSNAALTVGHSARSNPITIYLITFWKFHGLVGVNWNLFGTVPIPGTFLRNLETPFGGVAHRSDETHKVLRSVFPCMSCKYNSQRELNPNYRLHLRLSYTWCESERFQNVY